MKKIYAIILCAAALQLCACNEDKTLTDTNSANGNIVTEANAADTESVSINVYVSEAFGSEANTEEEKELKNKTSQTNLLGGLSPDEALTYMKSTENLVIVEVNTAQWKKSTPFTGAMWIPHDEMAERYNEIPEGCPVILHCGAGIVSVPAYETLIEKRPDIPELSYIDGAPPIREYNEWYENNK